MKIVNLSLGKNPPVIRVYSGQAKWLCYALKPECCDSYDSIDSESTVLYIPNVVIPNTYPMKHNVKYRVYNETYEYTGQYAIHNNKFRIRVPALDVGYYYVEVVGYGTKNIIMLNVL